jgi:hypothetical protein
MFPEIADWVVPKGSCEKVSPSTLIVLDAKQDLTNVYGSRWSSGSAVDLLAGLILVFACFFA